MDTLGIGYEYFLYPLVNGTGTSIIVSVPVDTRTYYTLFKLKELKH